MSLPETALEVEPALASEVRTFSKQKSIFRHASFFLAATYLSRAVCAARAFINARWLGPEIYGFVGTLSFITSFAFHLHLGALETMIKEVPTHLRHGRKEEACRVAQITFTFYSLMLTLAGAGIWIYAFSLPPETPAYVRHGWLAVSFCVALEIILFFQQTFARVEQRFNDVSVALLIANTVGLVLTFWLVRSYGIYGLLALALLTPALGICLLIRRTDIAFKFAWSTSKVVSMIRSGFPILAMTLVFEALWWIDRFLILNYLGPKAFGYYLLGVLATQLCFLFPQGVASVVEPYLHYDYASSQNKEALRLHLLMPLRTLALLMPLGLAVLDLVLPLVIQATLPAYAPAIPTMRILIWGSQLMGFAICTKAFVVALNKQKETLSIYGVAICVNLLVSWILAKQGMGLIGIATGTLLAYFVCSSGLLLFSFQKLGHTTRESLKLISRLLFPLAAAVLFTVLVPDFLAYESHVSETSALWIRAGGIFIYAAATLFYIEKKIGIRQIQEWVSHRPSQEESAV